jgi:sensor domain CHASE-containing protein
METIFRGVSSIGVDERRIYESVVGHSLGNDQCVVIRVVERDNGSEEGFSRTPEVWNEQKNCLGSA